MLQVVAVDDIVQASHVAFIEQEEIDSLDRLFEEHAQKALAEVALAGFKELRAVYLDNPGETDPGRLAPISARKITDALSWSAVT